MTSCPTDRSYFHYKLCIHYLFKNLNKYKEVRRNVVSVQTTLIFKKKKKTQKERKSVVFE